MKYCPGCGTANKPTSKFCSNCGALLSAPTEVRCAICGSLSQVESLFCNTCGARLSLKTLPEKPASLAPLKPRPSEPDTGNKTPPSEPAGGTDYTGESQEAPKAQRKPYMPEWVARLRTASPAERNSPALGLAPAEEDVPVWLQDLIEADKDTAERAAEQARVGQQDWLANLRAVASAGEEEARRESPAPVEEGEPLPIPKWFENIRPPTRSPRVELTPPESSASAEPTLPLQPLPGWLVELQNLEPGRGEPEGKTSETPAPTPPGQEEPRSELPEWLAQMGTASDDAPDEPAK